MYEQPKESKTVFWVFLLIFILILGGIGFWWFNKNNQETSTSETPSTKSTDDNFSKSSKNNKNGPYYHQIYSASSPDGLKWTKLNKLIYDHASVPGAIIKDAKIYLYFVDASGDEDQLSVAISADNGATWDKKKAVFDSMASYDVVDPNPVVIDGKIRLYFLGDFMSKMANKSKSQSFTMYWAESTDGINFNTPSKAYSENEVITDPDTFQTASDWRMFVSKERSMELLTSKDSGKTFTKDTAFSWNGGGISSTVVFGSEYRTYYCGEGINYAIGANSGKLTDKGVVLQETNKIACDPTIVKLPDSTYLMFYKTQTLNNTSSVGNNPTTETTSDSVK